MTKICYVVTIAKTVEAFFIPQLQYLAKKGYDVTIVCSGDLNLQDKLGDSIRFFSIEMPRGISFINSVVAIISLIKFFRKENFDIIQYSTPNAAFYSSIAAKVVGCKIRNYHLMGLRYLGASGVGKFVLKLLEKITCKNSTSIECVSNSNMELGISEGLFPREKVSVIWNGSTGGVDLSRFNISKRDQWRDLIRKELGYKVEDFVFGFVGRITKDKGINELLEAFFDLGDDSKLLLIGDFENIKSLNEELIIKSKKCNYIKFHGFVSDIERYYAAIDVLVLPSYREGFGNVVIEAGAVGTPSIVTDIPGPVDTVIQGKTGIIVPVKNVEALKKSLKSIQNSDYITMGKNAAVFAKEQFDSHELCNKIYERKEHLIGTR